MKQALKKEVNSSSTVFTDAEVLRLIKEAWDQGELRSTISRSLNTNRFNIDKVTQGWTRDYVKSKNYRSFDYHITYCLLFEHGLTYKEAAQALEVKEKSLRAIICRNKAKLDESFPSWKRFYKAKRSTYKYQEFLQAAE